MNIKKLPPSQFKSGYRPCDLSYFKPLEVNVRRGREDDSFRYFKSLVQKEKVLTEAKERMHYEKPSIKKRKKKKAAMERRLADAHKEKMMKSGEWDKKQKQKLEKRYKKDLVKNEKTGNEWTDEDYYVGNVK